MMAEAPPKALRAAKPAREALRTIFVMTRIDDLMASSTDGNLEDEKLDNHILQRRGFHALLIVP